MSLLGTSRSAWLLLVLALAPVGCGGRGPALLGPPPKGLVLVVVDTLRADAVIDEEGRVKLPVLGGLGEEAAVFRRCTSHASLTMPSHATLFTSRMPSEAGVVGNDDVLAEDVPILAEWLGAHGYQTLAATSFQLGGRDGSPDEQPGLTRGFQRLERPHLPLRWADETLESVERLLRELKSDEPFFLFFHFVDPHYPYRDHGPDSQAVEMRYGEELLERLSPNRPEYAIRPLDLPQGERRLTFRGEGDFKMLYFDATAWQNTTFSWRVETGAIGKPGGEFVVVLNNPDPEKITVKVRFCLYDSPSVEESRTRYAREVEQMDGLLGGLFETLKDRGLFDESLIVLTSDHGEALGEHGVLQHSKNLYEELVHVPLIVRPPRSNPGLLARLRAGTGELVGLMDVVPTALEILGLPELPGQRGRSILGPRPALQFAEGHPPYAERLQVSVRDERYKMIFFPEEDGFLFFDLQEDPDENADLFAVDPGRRPDWPERLRNRALGLAAGSSVESIDPGRRRELEALGYLGGASDE